MGVHWSVKFPIISCNIYIYIHTYIHACMHTYINTYIHTYIHPYIHTYIHTNHQIPTYANSPNIYHHLPFFFTSPEPGWLHKWWSWILTFLRLVFIMIVQWTIGNCTVILPWFSHDFSVKEWNLGFNHFNPAMVRWSSALDREPLLIPPKKSLGCHGETHGAKEWMVPWWRVAE